ncbi:MAG: hypothetical protein ACHQX4_10925, partial [Gemmatimonadales bacterium]
CLRYEHEFYVQSRKRFPKEGRILELAKGKEKVHSIDIFRDRVTLRAEDGTARIVELADLKGEMETAQASQPVAAVAELESQPRPEGRARQEQDQKDRKTQAPEAQPAGEVPRRRRRRRRRRGGHGGGPAGPGPGPDA